LIEQRKKRGWKCDRACFPEISARNAVARIGAAFLSFAVGAFSGIPIRAVAPLPERSHV
jgi:hypothetical protein